MHTFLVFVYLSTGTTPLYLIMVIVIFVYEIVL